MSETGGNINKITKGTVINGDLVAGNGEDLEIEGKVKGNVKTNGKINITGEVIGNIEADSIYTSGARIRGNIKAANGIKIGNESVIIGDISADNAVLAGAVKGTLDIRNTVVISESGILQGNVKGKGLEISGGAVIEGNIDLCYADIPSAEFFAKFDDPSPASAPAAQPVPAAPAAPAANA